MGRLARHSRGIGHTKQQYRQIEPPRVCRRLWCVLGFSSLPKLRVAGSSPVSRSNNFKPLREVARGGLLVGAAAHRVGDRGTYEKSERGASL